MKKIWNQPRSREDVINQIPESYLAKDAEMQERRQLTFILQESAFSEHIPIYCTIDISQLSLQEQQLFLGFDFEVKSAIILGHTIKEPFLFAEQVTHGLSEDHTSSCAEMITKNYLLGFQEKLEMQGYHTQLLMPDMLPNKHLADMMSCSHKGVTGKNGRFIAGAYGAQVSVGMILTDAPLMGGDYRFPDVVSSPCLNCNRCIEACPAKALTSNGFSKEACIRYRNEEANQLNPAPCTTLKCMKCMEVCPSKY